MTATAGILIIGKLTAWLMTGSSSLLASLTDSMMDISASLISLLAVRYALIPADDNHQFGHGKAESLASLAQAAFITGSAVVLLMHGLDALVDPKPLQHINVGIWISIASLALTLILVSFQSYVIQTHWQSGSKADSLHYRSRSVTQCRGIAGVSAVLPRFCKCRCHLCYFTGRYILWSALQIGYDAIQTLLDRQLPEEECQQISDICCAVDGVRGIHDLKTRLSGRCVLSSYTSRN